MFQGYGVNIIILFFTVKNLKNILPVIESSAMVVVNGQLGDNTDFIFFCALSLFFHSGFK